MQSITEKVVEPIFFANLVLNVEKKENETYDEDFNKNEELASDNCNSNNNFFLNIMTKIILITSKQNRRCRYRC